MAVKSVMPISHHSDSRAIDEPALDAMNTVGN